MAIKRGNDFRTFSRNFSNQMLKVDDNLLRNWTLATVNAMTNAQRLSPVASGTLEGSADYIRARVTSSGVQSAILFKVPYAKKLNDKNSGIRLKNKGEISYYVGKKNINSTTKKGKRGGTVVKKQRKGRLGFLDIAVDKQQASFNAFVGSAVSKAFLGI